MRTVALCAASDLSSTRQAAGVEPWPAPPLSPRTFAPDRLAGVEFLYVKLHGLPSQPYWYGDDYQTAVRAEQIAEADLTDCRLVFAASCFTPESPMLQALFEAGARYVIAGEGENYAGINTVRGADVLGRHVRRFTQAGIDPQRTFKLSKLMLTLFSPRTPAIEDTKQFRLFSKEDHHRHD